MKAMPSFREGLDSSLLSFFFSFGVLNFWGAISAREERRASTWMTGGPPLYNETSLPWWIEKTLDYGLITCIGRGLMDILILFTPWAMNGIVMNGMDRGAMYLDCDVYLP